MGAPSPRCTAEFKQEAVELYGKSGTAYAEAARGPGCDRGPVRLGQEGRRGRLRTGDDPFQMAADLRRLKRENERLKRAKFKFIFLNEGRRPVSEMCAALGATRRGHCARKGRPPSAHAMRDGGSPD